MKKVGLTVGDQEQVKKLVYRNEPFDREQEAARLNVELEAFDNFVSHYEKQRDGVEVVASVSPEEVAAAHNNVREALGGKKGKAAKQIEDAGGVPAAPLAAGVEAETEGAELFGD